MNTWKNSSTGRAAILSALMLAIPVAPAALNAESATNSPPPPPAMSDFNLKMLAPEALERQGAPSRPWLGLATEEAPEVLTSQLRLDPGVGLVVIFVATNSPAAKAGLVRDDVLVALGDQSLVHPQQLRKLIQVRKEGDPVKLTYYRAGKRDAVTVTLAKAPERSAWLGDGNWLERHGYQWRNDIPWDQYRNDLQEHMKGLQHSLGDIHIDQKQIQEDVRRSMDQARRAAEDALRNASNEFKNLGPSAKALEDLSRGWFGVRKDATVTVNSSDDSVQTLVKSDDSGIYVLVANPRKHLTVHDKAGKLIFDGEIETPAQQAAVPKAIWDKARPLADKIATARPSELVSPDE